MKKALSYLGGTLAISMVTSLAAASPASVTLILKNHRFSPTELSVPAGQPIEVTLINQDLAMEEFDSRDLGVEQDVTPRGRAVFRIGPLKPGEYQFEGELHAATARGKISAVAR